MNESRGTRAGVTPGQWDQWCRDGYLVVPGILGSHEVARFRAAATAVHTDELDAEGRRASGKWHSVRIARLLEVSDRFDDLIDHAAILPVLAEVVGPFVQLLGANLLIREPAPEVLEQFHTDGGLPLRMLRRQANSPALQVKVQFFLTDLMALDAGNFMVLPGTHLDVPATYEAGCYVQEANAFLEEGDYPSGTVQVRARAGDVVIFDYGVWHGVARHLGDAPRVSVILAYGQLCLRPHEHRSLPDDVLARLTVRQRRMCGDLGAPAASYYYPPKEEGLPWSDVNPRSL